MRERTLNVYSEIGKLKSVLLHRPGKELENLTPDSLDRLLFDDIPFLDIARYEHDAFAKILIDNNIEVLYLEDLAAEAITNSTIKEEFVDEFISEAKIYGTCSKNLVKDYLMSIDTNQNMILNMMEGIKKTDITSYKEVSLADMVNSTNPFICDAMPNLYFTRDPAANIGHGVSLNKMRNETRQRETLFSKYILKYHQGLKMLIFLYGITEMM